jgi:2'-5' RNA ligase
VSGGRAPSGTRARLFVALELPDEVCAALAEWRDAALGDPEGVRAIGPQDLHVTLCFLGLREQQDVGEIARALDVVGGREPLELAVGEPVLLPRRRPRVAAVGLEDPDGQLAGAQATLATALEAGGFYEPEDRPFYAHVTLARAGRRGRIPRTMLVEPAPPRIRFSASRVVLYRSRLRRSGARYEALATVELGR